MSTAIYEDCIGSAAREGKLRLSEVPGDSCIRDALITFYGKDIRLSPPQEEAIGRGILDRNVHFLISAPTNSGKTLIALLRILRQVVTEQARCAYVVPLKALAEEKADELRTIARLVEQAGGPRIRIAVSTGDYQMSSDLTGSPPPDVGEVIVCTPERLEVILRNKKYLGWAHSLKSVVIDEFHLLGEPNRGAKVEVLITRLLLRSPDSSILGLSATIGGMDRIADWLGHTGRAVEVVQSDYRYPALRRRVLVVRDKNEFVKERAKRAVASGTVSLLVFVYRKSDAEKLCKDLIEELPSDIGIEFFHAGVGLDQRLDLIRRYRLGEIRILVATTTLKMGVNTPANEVIVRDTVFHGSGAVGVADILQMIGRAGRGEGVGLGQVVAPDEAAAQALGHKFENGDCETLQPQLLREYDKVSQKPGMGGTRKQRSLSAAVLAEVAFGEESSLDDLCAFVASTFSGWCEQVARSEILRELRELEKGKLVFHVDNSEATFAITKLGRTVAECGLSPESGAMIAGVFRALINLSEKAVDRGQEGNFLGRLSDLDLLIVVCAAVEARPDKVQRSLKRNSIAIAIDSYVEQLPPGEKPLLYRWRIPASTEFPTRRLLSSLRLMQSGMSETSIRQTYYSLLAKAVLLQRHANGESLELLAGEYGLAIGEVEASLKPTAIWVLSCIAQICDPQKCYKLRFLSMRCFELLESLNFGATLGRLLAIKGVGRRSVQKLVDAGFGSMEKLGNASAVEIAHCGLPEELASRIVRFASRSRR